MYIQKMSRTPATEIERIKATYQAHLRRYRAIEYRLPIHEVVACKAMLDACFGNIQALKKVHADDTKELSLAGVLSPETVFGEIFLERLRIEDRRAGVTNLVIEFAEETYAE